MTDRPPAASLRTRASMLAGWAVLALLLAAAHVHWRDEVRAFSIALSGDTIPDMLRILHGEGHPALWYLLLRIGHELVPVRHVLPATAFIVGLAAAALLALRSPFQARTLGLALFGYWSVFEYTVSARNYGIAVALMLLWASLYPRLRRRGPWLGLILALICNTSAPAVLLAGALALYWIVDLLREARGRWTAALRNLLVNLAITAAGVAACAFTIYPSYNDAALPPAVPGVADLIEAATLFARPFAMLVPPAFAGQGWATALLGMALLGSLAALVRSPPALAAGVAGLWSYSLFFQLTYGGGYRHQALLLPFLLTLHWLVAEAPPVDVRSTTERLRRGGSVAFALLLAAQLPGTIGMLIYSGGGGVVSRAAELGRLVRARGLEKAAVIAVPDVLVEPLAYYLPNPTYLVRERRWGRVVRFSREGQRLLELDEVLATANRIARERRQPVLILAGKPLSPVRGTRVAASGFTGPFVATPEQVRRFRAATRRIASFAPAATDESYEVYLLPAG